MEYIIQLAVSFVAVCGLAIIFNAPIKLIPQCGIVGAIAWTVNYTLTQNGVDAIQSSFVGAFIVAIIAHIFARIFKVPMLVFSVSGIISLVPGSTSYNAMLHMISSDYIIALEYAMRAMMIAGSLALGLICAEVCMTLFLKLIKRSTSIESFNRLKKARKLK